MKTKYMIRREFYGLMPNLGVFDNKELAERQIELLPEVMTDYDHFAVEEIPCPECEEEFTIDFRRAYKKQAEEKSNG